IPPNRTMPFITDAGLGAPFVDVDPKSFRSTRDERIYAVGDNADTPYAKTGYTAMDSARVAAGSIAGDLGVSAPAAALPANVCYPLAAPERGLQRQPNWAREQDATRTRAVTASGRQHDRH